MTVDRPRTLGELAASGYRIESVKDEMRRNLIALLKSGGPLSRNPGLRRHGRTAGSERDPLQARHSVSGLAGQAKTRMLRQLVRLLDDAIPIVAGSEIHDDPFAPVSKTCPRPGRRQGRRHPDRMDRPRRSLSRKARHARRHHRRLDRRGRYDQARRGAVSLERADDALRPDPPCQPRHLLHQRAARPRAQDPGRTVQRARRAGRADPRLSRAAGSGPLHGLLGATPRTTPTAAGSSRRSRIGSGRSSARTIRPRARSASRSATRTHGSTGKTTASRHC